MEYRDILTQKMKVPSRNMVYDSQQVQVFLERQRLHDLVRLYRYAQKSVTELLVGKKLSFWADFCNVNRHKERYYEFWIKLQKDISCVRTRMMLEVLLRNENIKINRSGMTFVAAEAEKFCSELTENQRRLLEQRVSYRYAANVKALNSYLASPKQKQETQAVDSLKEAMGFWKSVLQTIKK